MTISQKILPASLTAASAALLAYLLARPSLAGRSVSESVRFCLTVIIPSLFVYMALAGYLFPRLINLSGGKHAALTALTAGLLCGFPIGAKLSSDLFDSGSDPRFAEYVNTFSNNAGLSFVTSFAGATVLGSRTAGFAIAAFQLVSSLLCAAVMKKLMLPHGCASAAVPRQKEPSLSKAAVSAASSMLSVCACITVFMCVSEAILTLLPRNDYLSTLVKGFFEFSAGIESSSGLPGRIPFVITSVLIGWSGCSVHLQVKAVVGKRFGLGYYFLSKILQAAVMGGLALLTSPLLF